MPAGKGTGRAPTSKQKKILAGKGSTIKKAVKKVINEKNDQRAFNSYWDKKFGGPTPTQTERERGRSKKK